LQEDTISINHNWLNGCNVDISWNFLKQNLQDVQREISDCLDMDGWHEQCQVQNRFGFSLFDTGTQDKSVIHVGPSNRMGSDKFSS